MAEFDPDKKVFPTAGDDAESSKLAVDTVQTRSPSYKLAFTDQEFLLRDELRPVRLQLELLKPDLVQQELGIDSTLVIFGSARIPSPKVAQQRLLEAQDHLESEPNNVDLNKKLKRAERLHANSIYYEEARKLAEIITLENKSGHRCQLCVVTGGGPGIMEAANRGAYEAHGKSIGLNIVLPFEQRPNDFVTPELCFQFHYFAIRKMHFLKRAKALVACPGGFGTLDELFEALTLIQTRKIQKLPVLLMGKAYWQKVINFDFLVEEGVISEEDLELFQYVDNAQQAWDVLRQCYSDC